MSIEAMKQMVEALYYLEVVARTKSSQLNEALLQANQALKVGRQAIANAEPQASPWKEYWLDIVKENNDLHERIAEAERQEPLVTIRVVDEGRGAKDWEFVGINTFYDLPFGEHHIYAHPQPKQEQGEPVAYMYPDDLERMQTSESFCTVFSVKVGSPDKGLSTVELYTTPQQRKPLTDEQIMALLVELCVPTKYEGVTETFTAVVRAIEAAHGIKE